MTLLQRLTLGNGTTQTEIDGTRTTVYYRGDDINLRSTWLCSRNDLVANGAVLVAAVFVAWWDSLWPDLIVGVAIAILFLRTASSVLRDSFIELARARRAVLEAAG